MIESHPEIVWPLIGASRSLRKKKTDQGFSERNKLIANHLGIDLQSELLRTEVHPRGRGARLLRKKDRDDWADAAGMLIVAKAWCERRDGLPVLFDPPDKYGQIIVHLVRDLVGWKNGCIIALPKPVDPRR